MLHHALTDVHLTRLQLEAEHATATAHTRAQEAARQAAEQAGGSSLFEPREMAAPGLTEQQQRGLSACRFVQRLLGNASVLAAARAAEGDCLDDDEAETTEEYRTWRRLRMHARILGQYRAITPPVCTCAAASGRWRRLCGAGRGGFP